MAPEEPTKRKPASSSKVKKKKKSKARIPPYKTYQVVTQCGYDNYEVVRQVNQYDVLCVDDSSSNPLPASNNNSKLDGYDYSKQPGNAKYRMLVNLSQANFDNMVLDNEVKMTGKNGASKNGASNDNNDKPDNNASNDDNKNNDKNNKNDTNNITDESEAEEQDEVNKQILARSIVETIRDDWKAFFLRRTKPHDAKCTQWVDIGFVESVEEVELFFERNARLKEGALKEQANREAFAKVKVERQQAYLRGQQEEEEEALRSLPPQPAAAAAVAAAAPTQASTNTTVGAQKAPPPMVNEGGGAVLPPLTGTLLNAPSEQAMPPLGHGTALVATISAINPAQTQTTAAAAAAALAVPVKRKRGRPRKDEVRPPVLQGPKKKRGRPRKTDAQKKADAAKRVKNGKQGRKKLISVPGPRDALSIAPLSLQAPDLLQDSGALMLSPTGKSDRAFDFHVDTDAAMETHQTLGKSAGSKLMPPPGSFSPPPFPPPGPDLEQTNSRVVQAQRYVKANDPDWSLIFDEMEGRRINVYCHGQPEKWSSGLIRSIAKNNNKNSDTTLNHWIHSQQEMYRDYCAWEEQKYLQPWADEAVPEPAQERELQREDQDEQMQLHANELHRQMQQQMQQRLHPIVGAAALPPVLPDSIRLPRLGHVPRDGISKDATGTAPSAQEARPESNDEGNGQQQRGEKTGQDDTARKPSPSEISPDAAAAQKAITDNQRDENTEPAKKAASEPGNRSEDLRELQRAKILLLDSIRFVWQPDQEPPLDAPQDWKESFYDLREFLRSRGDTSVPDTVELGVWAQLQRMQFQRSLAIMSKDFGADESNAADAVDALNQTPKLQRPRAPLSRGQMAALRGLGFDWEDLESSQFHLMYLKLLEFKKRLGDCLIAPPLNEKERECVDSNNDEDGDDDDYIAEARADPSLFFWVERQRLENMRFQTATELAVQQDAGVDEDGHALVEELLEEEKEAEETATKEVEDNDDATVVAHLVRTPARRTRNIETQMGPEPDAAKIGNEKENEGATGKKRKRVSGETEQPPSKNESFQQQVRSSDTVSTLTQAHIDLLNSAGFIWSSDISLQWILQYRRLQAFFIKNGHSKVTKQCKAKLNRWCSQMRHLHHKTLAGKKFGLTQEKIDLLKKVDFTFEFDCLPERVSFDKRFEWLKKYKEENGNCDVPQKHEALGYFVKRLRKAYESHKRGILIMNPEKIRLLNEIGFTWRLRVVRGTKRRTKSVELEEDQGGDEEEEGDKDEEEDDDEETEEEEAEAQDDEGVEEDQQLFNSNQLGQVHSPLPSYHHHHMTRNSSKKSGSPGTSSFECTLCSGPIIYASAQCASCRGSYCQDCFDEVRHDHAQKCPKCEGPVAAMGSGWNV